MEFGLPVLEDAYDRFIPVVVDVSSLHTADLLAFLENIKNVPDRPVVIIHFADSIPPAASNFRTKSRDYP